MFQVSPDIPPQALERYLAAQLGTIDYLTARQWVQAGLVLVDGAPGKASRYVQPGQQIEVSPPPPKPHEAVPEDLPLPIRYADEHLVIVAKPTGMATHPGPGWWRGSCVNALLHAIPTWPGVGGVAGPGIVHRLDRDTTGLLTFAKTDAAHQALLTMAKERTWDRYYLAWVAGRLTGSGTIDQPLGRSDEDPQKVCVRPDGKQAITHWQSLQAGDDYSLISLKLDSGRNHQIRVHLASIGHPVLGDVMYGEPAEGLALHAVHLAFAHPLTGETLRFTETTPAHWRQYGEDPVALGQWQPW
jgi:23S rRNA pseudouridine1911/1915/1917 synthase